MQGAHVYAALEIDDLPDRRPVIGPTPTIELRRGGVIEAQPRFLTGQLQQVPTLLLTDAPVAHVLPRQPVAQPAACGAQDLHILSIEADLLLELAKQVLFHLLAAVHAA